MSYLRSMKCLRVFILLLLLLFPNVNFALGIHFCSGEFSSLFFQTHTNCCGEEKNVLRYHDGSDELSDACCQNTLVDVQFEQGTFDIIKSADTFFPLFTTPTNGSGFDIFIASTDALGSTFFGCSLPVPKTDILLFIQSFRI